ncbi:AraC family transcriptional regulator N-terminal domain-containing protein [Alkalicoccobacillus gibsonii]|uniref:AraC family transcriptional regulator N-terminal domain-containing protein n=1 Tax=Alkalicoccobacillus gibsonii TaxID=79881 RepID=UPI003512871D
MRASVDLPVVAQVIKASQEFPYLPLKVEISIDSILEVLRDTHLDAVKKENANYLYVVQVEG